MNDFDYLLKKVMAEAKAVGVPISDKIDTHIRVNDRAKTRFGRCTAVKGGFVIELSDRLLDAPEMSCRQTIAHELIHTCDGCLNHGDLFKKYAAVMNKAYGYNISRTNSAEEMGIERNTDYKYVIICQSCGNRIERTKRSSLVDNPSRYRCKCGGTLKAYYNGNVQPQRSDKPAAKKEAKYILLCLNCGKRIERVKLSEAVKNPSKYRCSCGGQLRRIK